MKYWYDNEFEAIVCEPNSADEWLLQIWEVGLDYDGCHSVESLQALVDELVDMAMKARECLHDGKILRDEEESDRSYVAAREERMRYENG